MNVNGRLMLLRFAIACGLDTANMAFLLLAMQICSPGMMSMLIQLAHGLSKLMVLTLPTRHSLVSTLSIISLRLAHVKDKTSEEAACVFNNTWLSHYPRPMQCIHDNGPEFKGAFQDLLLASGIKPVPVTPHTPQANSVIEATHLAVGQVICTLHQLKPPTTDLEASQLVDEALATTMHAC